MRNISDLIPRVIMENQLKAIPDADSIERKEDKHPSRIKPPQGIGWWLIGSLILIGAILVVGAAIHYRSLETFPPWLSFLSQNLLSLLLLAVVIAQAYIYHKQRNAMEEQRDAMHRQLEVMRSNERIASRQGDAFENQVTAMQGQLAAMESQVALSTEQGRTLRSQVRQTYKQVDLMRESVQTAQDSVKVAQDSVAVARESNAPYFGTSKITFRWVRNIPDGRGGRLGSGQPEVIICIMNGGKTPAWHLLVVSHLVLGNSPSDGKEIFLKAVHDEECADSETTFYPSGAVRCIKFQGQNELSDTEVEAVNSGNTRLFLVIELGYSDMKGDRTERTFYRRLNPATFRFADCQQTE